MNEELLKDMPEEMEFLKNYSFKIGSRLETGGEVGFGRPCVGLTFNGNYLEYDDDAPIGEDAYHKGPYLAVLTNDKSLESRKIGIKKLYSWCKELEKAGYNKAVCEQKKDFKMAHPIELMLNNHLSIRIIKG